MWVSDRAIITLARGLRQFAYGMLGIVLTVALTRRGFSPLAIGGILTVALLGDLVGTYLIGIGADGWGRRRTLLGLTLLMALAGTIFAVSGWYPLLLVAAFAGTLGTAAAETAPFLAIDQAMLAQVTLSAADGKHAEAFARYNMVASLGTALGALAAGLPDLLARWGLALDQGLQLMFGGYVLIAIIVGFLISQLSPAIEAPTVTRATGWRRALPPLQESRGIVARLAALFSIDAFAGGLTSQALMALYFHLRFGVSLAVLGALFFAANILAALSILLAPRLARRIGLLNTMVFTHLPSNILLALIPLMPNFAIGGIVLLLRQTLSQMDVPTRQAYTMVLVAPSERTAAASVTTLARNMGAGISPTIAGVLLSGVLLGLGLPFILAGALKSGYDLTLWALFRRVPVPPYA